METAVSAESDSSSLISAGIALGCYQTTKARTLCAFINIQI